MDEFRSRVGGGVRQRIESVNLKRDKSANLENKEKIDSRRKEYRDLWYPSPRKREKR